MRVRVYLLCFLVLTLFSKSLVAQRASTEPEKKRVIAEAVYSGSGMAKVVGKYLFARVYSDGSLEFDDYDESKSFVRRYSKMTHKQRTRLTELLSDSETAEFLLRYEAIYPTIDHAENLDLRLLVNGTYVNLSVENFKPYHPRSRATYPPRLVQIMCFLETGRGADAFRFFGSTKHCR